MQENLDEGGGSTADCHSTFALSDLMLLLTATDPWGVKVERVEM